MSVDVRARLKDYVSPEEIINFLRQKYDLSLEKSTVRKDNFQWPEEWQSGMIIMKDTKFDADPTRNYKSIFYLFTDREDKDDKEFWTENGLYEMVERPTTRLSMSHNDDSVEIMKAITAHFGGWIDESDCDDEPFYPVIKNENGEILPVLHVTMEDIYKKFGSVVIIDRI